jgi:hypothetical protein
MLMELGALTEVLIAIYDPFWIFTHLLIAIYDPIMRIFVVNM